MHWPRITLITPSFNQAQYLEDTLKSVLDQGYPNLEYLVFDGGSTDGSVDILKKYSDRLSFWESVADRGQSHAINKGMSRATGEVVAYINSDDYYEAGSLFKIAKAYMENPGADFFHGKIRFVDAGGVPLNWEHKGSIKTYTEMIDIWNFWWNKCQFVQPEVFWTRRIMDKIGLFREDFYIAFDYEYWCRLFGQNPKVVTLDEILTNFRKSPLQKTSDKRRVAEDVLRAAELHIARPHASISERDRRRLLANALFYRKYYWHLMDEPSLNSSRMKRFIYVTKLILHHPNIINSDLFIRRIFRR